MLIRGLVASGISLPSSGNSILIRKSIYFWQIQSKLAPPSDQKILWILSKEASLKEEKKIDTKMAVQTDPEGAPEPHVSWIPPSNFHPPAIKQPPPPSKKKKKRRPQQTWNSCCKERIPSMPWIGWGMPSKLADAIGRLFKDDGVHDGWASEKRSSGGSGLLGQMNVLAINNESRAGCYLHMRRTEQGVSPEEILSRRDRYGKGRMINSTADLAH